MIRLKKLDTSFSRIVKNLIEFLIISNRTFKNSPYNIVRENTITIIINAVCV